MKYLDLYEKRREVADIEEIVLHRPTPILRLCLYLLVQNLYFQFSCQVINRNKGGSS